MSPFQLQPALCFQSVTDPLLERRRYRDVFEHGSLSTDAQCVEQRDLFRTALTTVEVRFDPQRLLGGELPVDERLGQRLDLATAHGFTLRLACWSR
jgi:hypothetical protein